jgi:N-acetylglucosamine-6-phosphate deacetylase
MKVPGLVDLQVNGYKGVDFSGQELTEADFMWACREMLEAGTSAFLATMITSPVEVYRRNLDIIANVVEKEEFRGRLLGVHLEGPFISAEQGARGAHKAEWVRKPDIRFLEQLIEWAKGKVKLITIAAESEGAEELSRYAVGRGIAVSLGHQMAGEEELRRLVRAGATALTHLGNGVPVDLPRHNNPVWAGLANDELLAMVIADGHHLPAILLKTFIRAKGACRCIVVSDASPVAGLPAGCYNLLGNDVVLEEDGRVYNPHAGYLVGSSATILECMNYLASLGLIPDEQLLTVGFFNPLKLIGADPDSIQPVVEVLFDERQRRFILRK